MHKISYNDKTYYTLQLLSVFRVKPDWTGFPKLDLKLYNYESCSINMLSFCQFSKCEKKQYTFYMDFNVGHILKYL